MIKSIGDIVPDSGRLMVQTQEGKVTVAAPQSTPFFGLEPVQARALAALLVVAADEAERERGKR